MGVAIVTVEYGGNDPLGDVISWNLKRRHLTDGQRASVAAKLANMPRGGNGNNQFSKSANLQNSNVTQAQAAEMLNVSARGGDKPSPKDSNFETANLHNRNQISQAQAAQQSGIPSMARLII